MKRSESRKLWERVASGDFDAEVLEWLQRTARQVVEVDGLPDAVRPGEMLRAVGLSGRADRNAPLRETLEVVDSFPFLDESGEPVSPERGQRMDNLMGIARASGLLRDDPADHELRKRIERMLGNTR